MIEHKTLFDSLLKERNGLSVHSIHEVNSEILDLEPKEKLEAVGIIGCDPIFFEVKGRSYCKNGKLNGTGVNTRGDTITSVIDGKRQQIIFLQGKLDYEPSLSNEMQSEWNFMNKLSALAHELGHIKDLQSLDGINFIFSKDPIVDLIGAESYAHSYCLEYLNKINATIARNLIANALYRMTSSNKKFEKELYSRICKRIGKGRLKKWAKA
jgi:hypothetical protein